MADNQLFYGDNLDVLRRYVKDESVDLIDLDPPFNSRQDYNVLFAEKDGTRSSSQITAFEDTWEWNLDAEHAYQEIVERGGRVSEAMQAFRTFLGHSDMMAYLAMMAPRLIELQRVLKQAGSIYLHCDPTASHYLKMLMDAVFGPQNFLNEIVWKRNFSHNSAGRYGPVHDILLYYSKTDAYQWNDMRVPLAASYVASHYKHVENGRKYKRENITGAGIWHGQTGVPWHGINPTDKGRHWVRTVDQPEELDKNGHIYWPQKPGSWPYQKVFYDENAGQPIQDIWVDLSPINSQAQERLGYPTQKPESLLERIIKASSNEGDVVLDPFCGCGTAVVVAQRLKRRWVGIDVTPLATNLIKARLADIFGPDALKTYQVVGEPTSVTDAHELAKTEPTHFQYWALGLVPGARPTQEKKGCGPRNRRQALLSRGQQRQDPEDLVVLFVSKAASGTHAVRLPCNGHDTGRRHSYL